MHRALEPFVVGLGQWRRIVGAAGTALAVAAGVVAGPALPASAAPVGQVHEYGAGITTGSSPQGIAKGPDGNFWFTESNSTTKGIGRITLAGHVTEFGGLTSGANPTSIAAGPDGNMWFTEFGAEKIGRISPTGVVQEFPVGIPGDRFVQGIAKGPDGNMWFTEPNGNRIGKITTLGVVTEYGVTAGSFPVSIVAGPDGNMWFTESSGARIGKITPAGVVTEYGTGITPGSHPHGIAKGPDGNLWFTESIGNRIGRITTAGVVRQFGNGSTTADRGLRGIAAGPDGNMWFTELEAQSVARITPAGVITHFHSGITGIANPIGIAAGPGAMWFTEGLGNRVARIGTEPSMTCKVKGGINKPKLKVVCHVTVVKPSAKVKWKVKRHGHLVAADHTKLKHGKLVINLSHVAVHKGKNKVTVTTGKGTHKVVLHQTVHVHK